MIQNEDSTGENASEDAQEGVAKQPRPPKESFPLGRWIILLLIPLLFMLVIIPTGFVVESPGPSFDLQNDVKVQGAQTYSSSGKFMLTAVTIQESNLVYHFLSLFNNDYRNIKDTEYLGKSLDVASQALVDSVITLISQDTANVEALRQTGNQVAVQGLGAMAVSVLDNYPAFGVVNPGDVIVAANGKPVTGVQDLRDIISSSQPGAYLKLEVRSINEDALKQQQDSNAAQIDLAAILDPQTKEYEVQVASDPETGRPVIGVALRDYFTYSSDVKVDWSIENVKGPSAGLMMTLSLINALTPQDLTGGMNIAGTGEIFLSGQVGPIGGLPMKIKAAESRGAEVFIYPRANEPDIAGVSTDLKLYPVDNLQEALDVLAEIGK